VGDRAQDQQHHEGDRCQRGPQANKIMMIIIMVIIIMMIIIMVIIIMRIIIMWIFIIRIIVIAFNLRFIEVAEADFGTTDLILP